MAHAARLPAPQPDLTAAPRPRELQAAHPIHRHAHARGRAGFDFGAIAIHRPTDLLVGQLDDPLEHEADRAADQVLGDMPAAAPLTPAPVKLNRQCAACEEEERLQRKAAPGGAGGQSAAPAVVHDVLRSPGRPLDTAVQADLGGRFGADLSGVRVHTDAQAAASAQAVQARAYTVGREIVFGAGEYAPSTSGGRRLLAHELAHVVQQGVGQTRLQRAPDYAKMSIPDLRKLVKKGDKAAVDALYKRYEAMTNTELAPFASGQDRIAQDVFAKRTVPPKAAEGQGPFSEPEVRDTLAKDISNNRAATKIKRTEPTAVTPEIEVEGGTVGAARTDIPGLKSRAFVGQSPRAGGPGYNAESNFHPATSHDVVPHTFGHAEQHIADQLEKALADIPREQLKGRTVWMLIEQEVCATCGQGVFNLDTAAGVLKKLSQKYPELTFEIKNLQSSAKIILKGGVSPGAAAVKTVAKTGGAGAALVEGAGRTVGTPPIVETPHPPSVGTAAAAEAAEVGASGFRIAGRFLAREAPGLALQLVFMLLFPPGVNIHDDKADALFASKLDPAFQTALAKLLPAINKSLADQPSKSIYAVATIRLDYRIGASKDGDLEATLEDLALLDVRLSSQEVVNISPKFKDEGSLRATRQATYSLQLYESEPDKLEREHREYEQSEREDYERCLRTGGLCNAQE